MNDCVTAYPTGLALYLDVAVISCECALSVTLPFLAACICVISSHCFGVRLAKRITDLQCREISACVLKQTIGVLAVVCWHTFCCLKDCVWYVESGC